MSGIGSLIKSRSGLKYDNHALDLLSAIVYNETYKVFHIAALNVIHAKRVTLFPKDLELAQHANRQYS